LKFLFENFHIFIPSIFYLTLSCLFCLRQNETCKLENPRYTCQKKGLRKGTKIKKKFFFFSKISIYLSKGLAFLCNLQRKESVWKILDQQKSKAEKFGEIPKKILEQNKNFSNSFVFFSILIGQYKKRNFLCKKVFFLFAKKISFQKDFSVLCFWPASWLPREIN
jgi:hypothetical protein